MELRTQGIEVHLDPLGPAGPEGWTHLQIEVRVSGFYGRYAAQIQVEDLKRFANELGSMEDGLGRESKAALCSAEPDLSIELTMNRLGQISGRYVFESERRGDVPTALTGAFEMDQSFLPSLRKGCEALISQLSQGSAYS